MMRHLSLVVVFLVLVSPALSAQDARPAIEASSLQQGSRVRVSLLQGAEPRLVGRLHSLTSDSLVLRIQREPVPRGMAIEAARSLEVSRGRSRVRWGLTGALAGAAAGVLYTRAFVDSEPSDLGGLQGTVEGIGNTLTGMVGGAVLGWAIAPERWAPVSLPGRSR